MGCLGNILWFIFGGCTSDLSWLLTGCLWCMTIIGVPTGLRCFKFTGLSFFLLGKEMAYGGGVGSLFPNITWPLVSSLPLAIESAIIGILLYITIVGTPFGLQQFELAKLAVMSSGSQII